jgi:hypothetical protein
MTSTSTPKAQRNFYVQRAWTPMGNGSAAQALNLSFQPHGYDLLGTTHWEATSKDGSARGAQALVAAIDTASIAMGGTVIQTPIPLLYSIRDYPYKI